MSKFTKDVYTNDGAALIARFVAHQAGLADVGQFYDSISTRKSKVHPHKVRITITVERVHEVPVATDTALLKPGTKVLMVNQINPKDNGVRVVGKKAA